MQRRILSLSISSLAFLVLLAWGCTKIDTTSIGSDLIPEVDNVNTFADTLEIITTQGVFDGIYRDTTKLSKSEEPVLGMIENSADPMMGGTKADLYLQFKPPFYPYYIGRQPKDTIVEADSVVLCLSYKSFYGDSTTPVQLQVYRVSEDASLAWDSVIVGGGVSTYMQGNINFAPLVEEPLSNVVNVDIRRMKDTVKISAAKDPVINQIRIKLSNTFRDQLFSRDSVRNSIKNAFIADSVFRLFNNGFAIKAQGGKALMYLNLLEDNTRLELHYKKKNGGPVDTTYSVFYYNSGLQGESIRPGSVANNIVRTRNALPVGDQELYLQTTPGTFANLYIPGLSTMPNRIIHRAEIQIEQIPDPVLDKIFTEPNYLYLDLVDTGATKWKSIYFDLNPNTFYDPDFKTKLVPFYPANGEVDFSYFGGFAREKTDAMGERTYYTLNITRHVQQIVTRRTNNYKFRLFPAHSFTYPQHAAVQIPYRNAIAYGRVKIGGGANTNPQYRMKVRVIYSNIK